LRLRDAGDSGEHRDKRGMKNERSKSRHRSVHFLLLR
jgi:predicted N-acyltransferase